MSLKDLSKEQKQYVALGLIAVAIIAILMVLGLRFSMATVSAAKVELDDLTAKIESAEQALSRSRQTSEDYVETVAVLKKYLTNAPPERNYYSWATEVIYSTSRLAALEIDSIDEISIPQRSVQGDDAASISFESYSLRITGHGSYENTKDFLNLLMKDYPLVRFSGIEISSGQSPDTHDVQLFMQWPFNFGEISKNWDAVADKQIKIAELNDGQEVPALKEPEASHEPATPVSSIANPDPVREPYPPTTRPEVEGTPAPKPAVEPTAPKTQPMMDAGSLVESSSADTAPKPATTAEIQALLSNAAPPAAERMDAEPQRAIAPESEPVEEPPPVVEPEAVAAEPEPIIEPQSVIELEQDLESVVEPQPELESVMKPQPQAESAVDPDPEPAIEQEVFQLNNEFETHDAAPAPEEPQDEVMEAAPQMDPPPASEVDPAPESAVVTQAVSAAPRNYVSTGKSKKILEELLDEGSTREDASLSSFLDGLVGEINEK
jgi:hypothetical protein